MRDKLLKIGHYFIGGSFGRPVEYINGQRVYCDISTWNNERLIYHVIGCMILYNLEYVRKDIIELIKSLPEVRKGE